MANLDVKEVTITRVFDAPRELVFKAFTQAEQIAQWWGPHSFDVPFCEVDARPGGVMNIQMRGPDGEIYPERGVFREVVPPERLVFLTSAFDDETGSAQLEVLHTLTFTEQAGKTQLVLQAQVIRAAPAVAEALAGMEQGWGESFEKLDAYLARAQTAK